MGQSSRAVEGPLEPSVGRPVDEATDAEGPRGTYGCACLDRDSVQCVPRWRDVADELPQEAQEVLFVRGGKTVHGAWIGGIFWHSNQKMAAAYWMPLPLPPNALAEPTERR